MHEPAPLQLAAGVNVEPLHAAVAHETLAPCTQPVQVVVALPSHCLAAQTSEPPLSHATLEPWGAPWIAAHVPGVATSHAWH